LTQGIRECLEKRGSPNVWKGRSWYFVQRTANAKARGRTEQCPGGTAGWKAEGNHNNELRGYINGFSPSGREEGRGKKMTGRGWEDVRVPKSS